MADHCELSRRVRFCVGADPSAAQAVAGPRHNSYAAWPSMVGLGAFYELEVRCRGPVDPQTGFLMNISVIDQAVRAHAIGVVAEAFRSGARPDAILGTLLERLQPPLGGRVAAVRWWLTPYYSLAMETARPDRALLSQRFEFCASHRLHCPELSDEENRRIFGECNHPSGHGHNYWLEPIVSFPLADGEGRLCLAAVERIVDERVIRRFDHRYLNHDVEEFEDLIPTVEHIARVCYELLESPIAGAGGRLERVTVWETDKTFCTYPVEESGTKGPRD